MQVMQKTLANRLLSFVQSASKTKVTMVLIKATWCNACTNVEPTWDSMSELMPTVTWVKYDESDATTKALMKKLNTESFPSIYRFENEKVTKLESHTRTVGVLKEFAEGVAVSQNAALA